MKMPDYFKNILAVIIGVILGGFVNMGIIILGPMVIPPPSGIDVTNVDAIASSMHLYEPKHFIPPFLAHAIGTLVGAIIAYLIAATHRDKMAYAIGAIFLLGGLMMAYQLPAPAWFNALDLLVAYLPMAWLGAKLGAKFSAPK
jgi:hypothetical protein